MITWQRLIFDKDCCAQAFRLLLTKIKSSRRISSSTASSTTRRAPSTRSKEPQSEEPEDYADGDFEREEEPVTPESRLQRERVTFKTKLRSTVRRSTPPSDESGGWNFDTSVGSHEPSGDSNNGLKEERDDKASMRTEPNLVSERRNPAKQSSMLAAKMKKSQLQSLQHANTVLVEENARLKDEIAHLEALNVTLHNDNSASEPAATFDDRRMRLVQAQNLQLQRQIHLLQDAIASHQEAESNLLVALNRWRDVIEAGCQEAKGAGAEQSGRSESGKDVKWMMAVPESLVHELKRVEEQIYSAGTAMNSAAESKLRVGGSSSAFLRSSATSVRMADIRSEGQKSFGHLRLDRVKVLETKLARLGSVLDRFTREVMEKNPPHVGLGDADREKHRGVSDLAEATRSLLQELGAFGAVVCITPSDSRAPENSEDPVTAMQIYKMFASASSGKEREKNVKCMLKQLHARHLSMENDMDGCRRESKYWQRAWQTQADIISLLAKRVCRLGNKKVEWCRANLAEPMSNVAQVFGSFQHAHQEHTSRQNPYLPLLIETLATQQSVLADTLEQWRSYSSSTEKQLNELFEDYEANRLVLASPSRRSPGRAMESLSSSETVGVN